MMIVPQNDLSTSWKVKELGELKAPLMICGGAYGNLEAFEALIERADTLSIPAENIIHTGDIIACCADPMGTIELMAGCNIHAIQGNVENALTAGNPEGGDLPVIRDAIIATQWYKFLKDTLEEKHRAYIARLPHQLTFKCRGRAVRVVHGSVSSINQYVFASDSAELFRSEFELAGADIIISGHSGIPFTRRFGHRVWHNSGGLGLPANDGTRRVWFSLAVPDEKYGLHFEHHSLNYDYQKARDKMKIRQLPEVYREALKTGIWPGSSQERLPEPERSRAGRPLDPSELFIVDCDFSGCRKELAGRSVAV